MRTVYVNEALPIHFEMQRIRRTKGLSLGEAAHLFSMRAVDLLRLEGGKLGLHPDKLRRVYEILKNAPNRNNQ